MGEFLALSASLEHLSIKFKNTKAQILSKTLDEATAKFLLQDKSPSRKVGGLDNRGSHFYLTLYWAEALASQQKDEVLKKIFSSLAKNLTINEEKIISELNNVQANAVDIGGYYHPNPKKVDKIMRPSMTLNNLMAESLNENA